MDNDVVQKNVRECLDMLPDGMVNPVKVIEWALTHKPNLEILVPKIIEKLKDDFTALGAEISMSVLDKEGLERAVVQAVFESKHGKALAAMDPTRAMSLLSQLMASNGANGR